MPSSRPGDAASGFTLVETLIATLIAVALVVGIGLLDGSLVRQRNAARANSVVADLAERKMEYFKALPSPATNAALTAGTYGPYSIDETGQSAVGAPYSWTWTIADQTGAWAGSKKITVTVNHQTETNVRCVLVTYLKTS
jgi:Tfp pilus assembly protein PilV